MIALLATNAKKKDSAESLFGSPLVSDRETETYSFRRWLESHTVTAKFLPLVSSTIPEGTHQNVPAKSACARFPLFWIIPTYKVSNSKAPVSMSSPEKFRLFVRNTTDPSTIIYAGFTAGIKQADNKLSGYGQGAEGYGKRLGAGLANATSAGFFRTFLFASLFHQDPRYFRQGSGPFKNRLEHAMIRPVVTRKDSGGRAFNWSGLLGSIAASSLSNAYYPATDRGVGPTFRRVATGIPISVIDNLIHEFGPDLETKFQRKH
jgi:hypothetical protein